MAVDLYSLLGVARSASQDDIKKAYRQKVKTCHPDLHPGDEARADQFKSLSSAFEILGDADLRGKYDRGEIDDTGQPTRPFHGGAGGHGGGADPFDDVFSGLFGGSRTRRRTGPIKGRNIVYKITVPFEDAATGGRRRMVMPDGRAVDVDIPAGLKTGQTLRLKSQGHASPTGGPPGDIHLQVSVGESQIWTRSGNDLRMSQPVSLETAVLGGRVEVSTPSGSVSLAVPAGSNTGTVLRLKGKGIADNKAPGHLFVRLEIRLDDPSDPELKAFFSSKVSP
ncbi:MAG: DnaJ C-terminal domain-containing protein [Pseudomonadota bacterium]